MSTALVLQLLCIALALGWWVLSLTVAAGDDAKQGWITNSTVFIAASLVIGALA